MSVSQLLLSISIYVAMFQKHLQLYRVCISRLVQYARAFISYNDFLGRGFFAYKEAIIYKQFKEVEIMPSNIF